MSAAFHSPLATHLPPGGGPAAPGCSHTKRVHRQLEELTVAGSIAQDPILPNLLREPLWRAADLGRPLPPSPHANSVCLPTWADVVAYEEGDPRVLDRLQTGYPRFFIHPFSERVFAEGAQRFANEGEFCQVYPQLAAARRCVE